EAMAALQTASRLIRKGNNEVQVLCVAPEFYPLKSERKKRQAPRVRAAYEKRMAVEAKSILEKAQSLLKEEEIEALPRYKTGSPSEVIRQLTSEYDLTVVGAKGKYRSPNLGIGPVASRVVEHASGAVLVARELTEESNLRVLVGVDGSVAS